MKIKRDLDSAADLAAPPMPPLGARPITAVFVAALVAHQTTTALSELSGAGEQTMDKASGVQEQASERPPPATVLC